MVSRYAMDYFETLCLPERNCVGDESVTYRFSLLIILSLNLSSSPIIKGSLLECFGGKSDKRNYRINVNVTFQIVSASSEKWPASSSTTCSR